MKNILITGATGTVGTEVIKSLHKLNSNFEIYAGVRNLEKDKHIFSGGVKIINFDFNNINTFKAALAECDILFLLRPPQISNVTAVFKPLIETAVQCSVKHIVFLSVQGVEKSTIIPHYKIEKLIVESNINYTFLRPAYFMQNFMTTLRNDLVNFHRIFLPASNTKFTLVDVTDIGEVTAKILTETEKHINKSYDLTNEEKLSFGEMANKLSQGLNTKIKYESPSLIRFLVVKIREKIPIAFILVLVMLHFLPRFGTEPKTTNWVEKITKNKPKTFNQFVLENSKILLQ